MAYVVMARKWRPKNFEEMVGQDHIARTLRNAIEGKRIGHAYLFTGTRGVGKTTSARILAKALNCEKGPTATPCDACESCRAISAGTSMDVLEIDGASNRGVGEIRELREQVKYAPMHGKFKVYIIDEVHMLTKEAFNALLKTLEEPPPNVVFLFATTEINKVPHTILSRVQRFDFKRISETMIRGRLEFICSQEGITFETEALEAISRKADGSMRDGLSLFDQVIAFSGMSLSLKDARRILGLPPDELFTSLLDALVTHNASACYGVIEAVVGEGIELGEFLVGFGSHLRDLLFARQEGINATALGFSEDRFRDLRITHSELRDGDLIRYGKIISDLLAGFRTMAHPRLHVEMGLLRMASLDRIATLSQLLQSGVGNKESTPEPPALAAPKKKNLIEPPPSVVQVQSSNPIPRPFEGHHGSETDSESESESGSFDRDEDGFDPEHSVVIQPKLPPPVVESVKFETVDALVLQWQNILEEVTAEPTLVAIHLGGSRLIVDADPDTLNLEVAHEVALDFFQASQSEGRRKVQALIKERLTGPAGFALKVSLRTSSTPPPTAVNASGKRRLLSDEPIVQSILQIFDGRIVATASY
jgi:DNA polymerase III subunit gamma/tau